MTKSMFLSGRSLLTKMVVIAAVLSTGPACNTTPAPDTTPTPQIVAERLTAEVYGELVVLDNCLRVNTDWGTSYLLVWPPGFTLERDGNIVKVADTIMGEKAAWRVGESVWLGGGEIRSLDEQTRQSVPTHCPGPYWIAGGLEMPATFNNLVLFFGFRGIEVESTGDTPEHGFSITGESILADGKRISVYEFINQEAAETEAALVSEDGFTITRMQGDKTIETHLSWVETPHFYHKDRIIAICAGDDPKITSALEALLGPQFAGGPSPPDARPFPTSTPSVPLIASTPTPTTTPRRIPLRRSDSDTTGGTGGQSLYRLVAQKEIRGDVIADRLGEDEMMCVQHFGLSPAQCICWIGPLENAGVRGGGLHGMRRIVILSGSAEEAALALIEDWGADLRATGGREPCSTAHLTVSYDGGLFGPEP